MLSVKVKNVDTFAAGLDRWLEKVEEETADVANGIVVEIFNNVLQTSPQFSGDFAGNWQYSINYVNTMFQPLNLLDQLPVEIPFIAGGHPAIRYAQAMNKGRDTMYKLGDTFYLANSAVHDDPYALKIDDGEINFRQGNEGGTLTNAVNAAAAKYHTINPAQALRLRRKKL